MQRVLGSLVLSFLTLVVTPALAEKPPNLELSVNGGVRVGGSLDVGIEEEGLSVNSQEGHLSFDSSPSYGGMVGYRVQPNGFVFLSYSRQETTAHYRQNTAAGTDVQDGSASIEYFQLGGNLEYTRDRFTPYGGLSLGTTRFASLDVNSGDSWQFSAVLDGGVKIMLLPMLYARLLARMPLTFQSGSVYCFSGFGCAVTLNGTPLVQGEFQAGVTLAF